MSPDLIDAAVANGAKGIVIAGVGNGNMNKASVDAAARAAKKGVVVVRSSRVATGTVGRNVEVNDDELGLHRLGRAESAEVADPALAGAAEAPHAAGAAAAVLRVLMGRCSKRTLRRALHAVLPPRRGILLLAPDIARGQDPPATAGDDSTLDDTIEAGEVGIRGAQRVSSCSWNHYEGPFSTFRVGAGVLYDGARPTARTTRASSSSSSRTDEQGP